MPEVKPDKGNPVCYLHKPINQLTLKEARKCIRDMHSDMQKLDKQILKAYKILENILP